MLKMKMLTKSWKPTLFTPEIMKQEDHIRGPWVVFFVLDMNADDLYSSIKEHLWPLIGYNPSPMSLYLHAALEIITV